MDRFIAVLWIAASFTMVAVGALNGPQYFVDIGMGGILGFALGRLSAGGRVI